LQSEEATKKLTIDNISNLTHSEIVLLNWQKNSNTFVSRGWTEDLKSINNDVCDDRTVGAKIV